MTNKEMLKCIRDHYGLQRNVDFARHFGISEQLANNWNNSGKLDYIEIYRRCPDISPDWLLSGGEGQMIRINTASDKQGGVNVIANNSSSNCNIGVSDNIATELSGIRADCLKVAQSSIEALKNEQQISNKAQEISMTLLEVMKNVTGGGVASSTLNAKIQAD